MKHTIDALRDHKNKELNKERENLRKLGNLFNKLP